MTTTNGKSSLAFLLSVIIHSLLAIAIIYTGLDMTLPEGSVGSTEIEFIGPPPQGSQAEDSSQKVDQVAAVKPPPPPPPPRAAPPKALPPAPVTTEVADVESESDVIASPEPEVPAVEAPPMDAYDESPDVAEESLQAEINEALQKEIRQEEISQTEETMPIYEEESPIEGTSVSNEAAYGTSSGIPSDSQLTGAPGNKNPEYPMWARLRRQEGVTVIQFDVLDDGSVANASVVQSSGFEALDGAALKAHQKWRYRPGKTGTFVKNYNFRLTGQAEEAPSQLRRGN